MKTAEPSGRLSDGRHIEKSVTFSSHTKRFETEIEEMNSGGEEKIEKGGIYVQDVPATGEPPDSITHPHPTLTLALRRNSGF